MSEVTTTYAGVEITYNEDSNRWMFEIDGRERSAETLTNAKKAIDAPERKKAKKFEKSEVWFRDWSGGWKKVIVTSFIEGHAGKIDHAWINRDGDRRKESLSQLFPDTPETVANIERYKALKAEENVIREKSEAIMRTMTRLTAPEEKP